MSTPNKLEPMWVVPTSLKEAGPTTRRRVSSLVLVLAILGVTSYKQSPYLAFLVDSSISKLGTSVSEHISTLVRGTPNNPSKPLREKEFIAIVQTKRESFNSGES